MRDVVKLIPDHYLSTNFDFSFYSPNQIFLVVNPIKVKNFVLTSITARR